MTDSARDRSKIHVVLPAYNEAARIERLLDRIAETLGPTTLPWEIVVVDDGSRDATQEIVRRCATRLPIHLEVHPVNLGLGPTIRDGLKAAVGRAGPGDAIVTMDADDTHDPDLIPGMVALLDGGRDVVIASRYQRGARTIGVPASRVLLSLGAAWLFRILHPIPGVKDYTCGYRAYRAEALRAAFARWGESFVDQVGFQCMVDILLKLGRMKLSFAEVPLVLRYDLKEGPSKMKVLRTVRATLALLFRRRAG